MNNKLEIFALCRSEKYVNRWKMHAKQHLGQAEFHPYSGYKCYYQFMKDALSAAKSPYIILCHDDIWLGRGFFERANRLIEKLNEEADNWGIAGNAGISIDGNHSWSYVTDPHGGASKSSHIKFASTIDGNLILINRDNLAECSLYTGELSGFHGYDIWLSHACLRGGKSVIVDPALMVFHESGGSQAGFDEFIASDNAQQYFSKNYINHAIPTLNGLINLTESQDYSYLTKPDNRTDLYQIYDDALTQARKNKPNINIYCRSMLNRPNLLKRAIISFVNAAIICDMVEVNIIIITDKPQDILNQAIINLDINYPIQGEAFNVNNNRYSRADLLVQAISKAKSDYIWFIDDDDFLYPNAFYDVARLLPKNNLAIIAANCQRIEEKWNDGIFPTKSKNLNITYGDAIKHSFTGDNHVPICGCIFPTKIMQKQLTNCQASGDYYEDYYLLLLCLTAPNIELITINKILSGISIRNDENTVTQTDRSHWNYSYACFMGEIINSPKTASPLMWQMLNSRQDIINDAVILPNFIRKLFYIYSLARAAKKIIKNPILFSLYYDRFKNAVKYGGLKHGIVRIMEYGRK